MESSFAPVVYTPNNTDNFFRRRHTATVSFAIGMLLFLLPFAELKCTTIALAGNTGIGIALGTEWKLVAGSNDLIKEFDPSAGQGRTKSALSSGPNIFLLVAIAAVIAALVISFSSQKWRSVVGMCAGILACIMLIAVMIQFKVALRSLLSGKEAMGGKEYMGRLIKISFTIWYYLSFAAFAVAAFFNYKHYKFELQDTLDRMIQFEFQEKRGI